MQRGGHLALTRSVLHAEIGCVHHVIRCLLNHQKLHRIKKRDERLHTKAEKLIGVLSSTLWMECNQQNERSELVQWFKCNAQSYIGWLQKRNICSVFMAVTRWIILFSNLTQIVMCIQYQWFRIVCCTAHKYNNKRLLYQNHKSNLTFDHSENTTNDISVTYSRYPLQWTLNASGGFWWMYCKVAQK